ncbi:MAG: type II toxin-antitoxin system RelE family toxin [Sulfuricurvum sp.]
MFDIEFSKHFVKQLDKIPDNVVKRFYDDLKNISENPLPTNSLTDVKKLQGKNDHYRLRVGKYRFLFTVIDEKVLVYFYDLGSRGDIYK